MLLPLGLGASCSPILTPDQVYSIARGAGFPAPEATSMVAIAMRESSLCPNAHNPGTLGVAEDSYGLWQINVKANQSVLNSMGISPPQLYNPSTNAAAAYRLWNGNDANLNAAWAINKTGPPYYYAEKYQANLPIAQAAAASVDGSTVASSPGTIPSSGDSGYGGDTGYTPAPVPTGFDLASMFSGTVSIAGYDVPIAGLAMAGLAVGLLVTMLAFSKR